MKTNYPKRICCILLCVAMALALTGCGAKKTQVPLEETPAVVSLTPEVLPAMGGELVLPIPTNAEITDPLAVNTEEMLYMFSLIYEGLVRLDASGQITACLAENWTPDESGRTWRFKLRNVRWQGSERLSSADVVYTYERISSLGSGSYYAYHAGNIESMHAVDENVVEITMKQSGIPPLYSLTFPIVRSGSAGEMLPAGTGPYRIGDVQSGRVSLVANESWWKQGVYIPKVTFLERDNNDTALASYAAGQMNMVPTSSVFAGKYREDGVTTVMDVMTQAAELLVVNNTSRFLTDANVRKAIAFAIERSSIVSNVYMNHAQVCDVPVAPDSWLYETKSKVYDYDPANARALLEAAGWADAGDEDGILRKDGGYERFKLTLLVCDTVDGLRKSAASLIAEQLKEVGIEVEIVAAAYTLRNDSSSDFMQKLNAGEFDLALMGLNFGRDANFSDFINVGGACNYGRVNDPALEKLVSRVNTAVSESEYRAAASAFQTHYVEELPCIVLYFRLNSVVHASRIQGLTPAEVREPDLFRTIDKWYMNVS